MQLKDDSAMLRQFVENESDEAFGALVARHINLVYSVALRQLGEPHQAEEITQAVFIILAKKAAGIRHEQALTSWLFQTTRLTANSFIRCEMRRRRREQEAYMQSVLEERVGDAWPEIAPLLDDAVGSLREKDRQAILLRYYEDWNLSEIGPILGVSEDAAEKRVSRALEKLRRFFARRGVHSTTAVIGQTISTNSIQAAPVALAKTVTAIAVAKGASTSGSALTLVKGALKIMAWTKAKTAVVAAVSILCVAGTTSVTVREIASSRQEAIYDAIFQHPDGTSMERLRKAPPMLIVLPNRYTNSGAGGVWTPEGKGVFVGASVSYLLCWAYGTVPTRMILPADVPRDTYDYLDTLPNGHQQALRAKVRKRFGLVAHPETRDTDVLMLKIKDEAALEAHRSAGGRAWRSVNGENQTLTYYLENQTLSDLTEGLEAYFDKPLLAEAGSSARYTFQLHWPITMGTEDLARSMQQQLGQIGLELVPTNMPIEMFVVEKAK